jgi:hypothetical protein
MGQSARKVLEIRRSPFVTWFTFLVGAPLGVGTLYLIQNGPWQNPMVQRYVNHLAEQAVVVLFCCCFAALIAKFLTSIHERYMQAQTLLPGWDGKPMPVGDVVKLQQSLHLVWDSAKSTYIGRRIANILTFVQSRGTADDLDDQMRTLSDNDIMALDGSYALNRFLIWAMPILGFLGTVLGITDAIGSINPAQLEQGGAENVTQGLTKAFDATALALGLTLVTMFFNYLVEKLEQSLLERVDQYVDAELAHRFVRAQGGSPTPLDLPNLIQHLVEKQVSLWEAGMQKAEVRWQQQAPQHDKLVQALDGALTRFGQRIVDTEKKLLERHQGLLDGLAKLAAAMNEHGRNHQAALARLTDAINLSVEMIANVHSSETQLIRLQEALNQNLGLLANSATFKQAVESLTAAIALLTTRVSPSPQATPRLALHKDAA